MQRLHMVLPETYQRAMVVGSLDLVWPVLKGYSTTCSNAQQGLLMQIPQLSMLTHIEGNSLMQQMELLLAVSLTWSLMLCAERLWWRIWRWLWVTKRRCGQLTLI